MKTVNDLIQELQRLPEPLREKPVQILCPNGLSVHPRVKRELKNYYDPLNHSPENIKAIYLTWE